MGAQRAGDIADEERRAGDDALARFRRIQDRILADDPDMSDDDRERLADRWAEDVDEAIRQYVIKQREEEAPRRS